MQSNKIIIDVDTGIDDALALAFASKTLNKQVIGITTCGGNVRLEEATKNTLRMLELLKWDIPVYMGASKSTSHTEFVHAYDYHGSNGLCDIDLPLTNTEKKDSATKFIIDSANKCKGKLDIICLATPTNVAKAIQESPAIAEKINSICMMGGALNVPGNQTDYSEYNFFQDPKAVEIVLSKVKNVSIVPLDVTNSCFIEESDLSAMKSTNKLAEFFKEAVTNWYRFFGYPQKRRFELYDPLAVSALTHKVLDFKKETIGINLSGLRQGEIFPNGKYTVKVADKVNAKDFKEIFLKLIQS
jgi:purine nucleosidase